jgi:hypothetical protein
MAARKFMKRIAIFVSVFALLLLVLAGAARIYLPHYLAREIEHRSNSALAERGLSAKLSVHEISWLGIRASLEITEPVQVHLKDIELKAQIVSRKRLEFCLRADQEAHQSTQWKNFEAAQIAAEICGAAQGGGLAFESVEASLLLKTPLRAQITIPRQAPHLNRIQKLQIDVPPQTLPHFQGWSPSLTHPARLEVDLEILSSSVSADLASSTGLKFNLESKKNNSPLKASVQLTKPKAQLHWGHGSLRIDTASTLARMVSGESTLRAQIDLREDLINIKGKGDLQANKALFEALGSSDLRHIRGPYQFDAKWNLLTDKALVHMEVEAKELKAYGLDVQGLRLKTSFECENLRTERVCRPAKGLHELNASRIGNEQAFEALQIKLDRNTSRHHLDGSLKVSWAGSEIHSETLSLDLASQPRLVLKLLWEQIPLAQLLKLGGSERLSGQGKVRGRLDFETDFNQELLIRPSSFESVGPGTLRYLDPTLTARGNIDTLRGFTDLLAQGQQALVFKALDNFHYRSLKLELTRPLHSKLSLKVSLQGSNPALAKGQPFDINIPIEGNLEGLFLESFYRTLAGSNQSREYIARIRKLRKP